MAKKKWGERLTSAGVSRLARYSFGRYKPSRQFPSSKYDVAYTSSPETLELNPRYSPELMATISAYVLWQDAPLVVPLRLTSNAHFNYKNFDPVDVYERFYNLTPGLLRNYLIGAHAFPQIRMFETPTTIDGQQSDFAPSDDDIAPVFRLSSDASSPRERFDNEAKRSFFSISYNPMYKEIYLLKHGSNVAPPPYAAEDTIDFSADFLHNQRQRHGRSFYLAFCSMRESELPFLPKHRYYVKFDGNIDVFTDKQVN